jgi:predicted MFS family arabinose efflux permease
MGAAAGGLVAGGWGIRPAFVIDSATFLLSIVFIAKIRYQPPRQVSHDTSLGGALSDYLDGLRYLGRHRDILVIVLQKAALTLFVVGAFEVLQVAIARDVFAIGDGGGISLGMMYAAIGVGSGLGPILARAITGDRERPLRIAIFVSYIVMAIGLTIVATLDSFGAVLIGTTIRSMGGGTLWVFTTQLLLQLVPEHIRGRVFSTEYALLTLSMAMSAGLAGWSLDQSTLAISGLLTWMSGAILVPGALWAGWILFRRG